MTGDHRWQARWIWAGPPALSLENLTPEAAAVGIPLDPAGFGAVCLFRRAFSIPQVPVTAPSRITADSRYVAWVNGHEVSRGPVRAQPRRLHYDAPDLAPYLRAGENTIAVLVRFYGEANPWWMPAAANFTLGGGSLVFEADLGDGDRLVTDGSWRAQRCPGWSHVPLSPGTTPQESVDARLVPVGWTEPGFDDSGWERANELAVMHIGSTGRHAPPSDPYGALGARPIPPLEGDTREARLVRVMVVEGGDQQTEPVGQLDVDEVTAARSELDLDALPVTIPATAEDATLVTLDFGEIVAGLVELDVNAPAGTQIDAAVAEQLTDAGALDHGMQRSGFRYIARGSQDHFQTLDTIGLRYARLAIRNPDGPVTLRALRVHERLHPHPAGPAFECSDELLERIHRVGIRTVALNAQDAYLDCPTREQRAYTGDAVVHQEVDLANNADWSLARWHPQLVASPRGDGMLPLAAAGEVEASDAAFIPDWPLHWIHSVHNLYRYTGDRELVRGLLAVAEGVLRWFVPYQQEGGLLRDVTGWVIIDWASTSDTDTSCALNALWARGLAEFAEMAAWLGDHGRAEWARARWDEVSSSFDRFWDESRGGYVDHLVDGEPQRPMSQPASAASIGAGLVPDARLARVVETLTDRSRLVCRSWFLQALFVDGNPDAIMQAMLQGPPPPDWDVERDVVEAQPFFRSVVHDAVARAGRADMIADLCRDWAEPLAQGETTWPESWFGGSHCHGWSSTPSRDLIVHVLGIQPATPGFDRVRVAPRLGSLAWARGSAPTPYGFVTVEVRDGEVTIDSPRPADVDLGDGELVTIPPGHHTLSGSGRDG